jgi:hypothetical protein
MSPNALHALEDLTSQHSLRISLRELHYLDGTWYVTHSGLLRIAHRKHCFGIQVAPILGFCDPAAQRWTFKAIVYRSRTCRGFVGYGDADPSNVSDLVRGAEMRVAETRAVNRALRKAYGIGICSVEEIGAFNGRSVPNPESRKSPQSANGNGVSGNRNYGGRTVRDRLCQLIRQHQLDASLVKSYAVEFCGVTTLREATRDQVEAFVQQLADWAEKDRNGLLCQLNSYARSKQAQEGEVA